MPEQDADDQYLSWNTPEVANALADYLARSVAADLHIGIGRDGVPDPLSCYYCGHLVRYIDWGSYLDEAIRKRDLVRAVDLVVSFSKDLIEEAPHWCTPIDGKF